MRRRKGRERDGKGGREGKGKEVRREEVEVLLGKREGRVRRERERNGIEGKEWEWKGKIRDRRGGKDKEKKRMENENEEKILVDESRGELDNETKWEVWVKKKKEW